MTVNKTLSLPLPVVNAIIDVADIAGRDFSGTVVMLLKLGLSVYKDQVREV